jgi:hemin uptake protein HemP
MEMKFPDPAEMPPDAARQAATVLDSTQLFGSKKLVLIRHNDGWYRLMVTRQNKLILVR